MHDSLVYLQFSLVWIDWCNLILDSQNVVYDSISFAGGSTSKNPAKNTDGWDTKCSLDSGDACLSFKPNSTNIVVQNLVCNGSHGVSVGSLPNTGFVTDN
ncbi:pectin lyase fold/virulence factor [Zopfochytrium polystomum]|nr:pectin lyase fold/virulence factor [Zopfochytrium polystomum]